MMSDKKSDAFERVASAAPMAAPMAAPAATAMKAEQEAQVAEQERNREEQVHGPLTEDDEVRRLELMTKDGLSVDEQAEFNRLMGRQFDQPDEDALAANVDRAPTDIEVARMATLAKMGNLHPHQLAELESLQKMTAFAARGTRGHAAAPRR